MNKKTEQILNKCLNKLKSMSKNELCNELNNYNIDCKEKYGKFNIILYQKKYCIEIFTKEFGYVMILDSEKELTPKYFDSVEECEKYIEENFKEIDRMKIKDYKLKKPVNISNLLEDGFNYSTDCKFLSKYIQLKGSIYLSIRAYLKDYSVEIDILDDDWCQYYIPFYEYKDNKIKSFKFLEQIIKAYHMEMDSLKSFEEK